jgi:putative transposase
MLNRDRYWTLDIAKADLFNYIERFHVRRISRQVEKSELEISDVLQPSVPMGVIPSMEKGRCS